MVLILDLYTSFFFLVDLLIIAPFLQCFLKNRESLQLPLFPFWDFASLGSLLLSNLLLRSPQKPPVIKHIENVWRERFKDEKNE